MTSADRLAKKAAALRSLARTLQGDPRPYQVAAVSRVLCIYATELKRMSEDANP